MYIICVYTVMGKNRFKVVIQIKNTIIKNKFCILHTHNCKHTFAHSCMIHTHTYTFSSYYIVLCPLLCTLKFAKISLGL